MIGKPHLNALEPPQLCDAFIAHPPEHFEAHRLDAGGGNLPIFLTRFDLLTTLDDDVKHRVEKIPGIKSVARALLRPRTIFAGTTVSEYAVFPACDDFVPLANALLGEMKTRGAKLAIFKDVPQNSPLLSDTENAAAEKLLAACRANGFTILEGQALAYLPVDFKSEEEYLARFSGTRRKNMRQKLRNRAQIQIEEIATGDEKFADEKFTGELYAMYENVFAQSEIHFDKLTREFFTSIYRDASNGGIVFLYRVAGKLIGWNLCFVCNGNLADKFIGLVYPDARDVSLYFVSWFHNVEFARKNGLKNYIVGWTDPKVKASLGAKFTFTQHAVFLRNPLYRFVLNRCQRFFEPDKNMIETKTGA